MQYFDHRDLASYSQNAKTLVSYFKSRSMPIAPRKRSSKGKQTNMYQRVAGRARIPGTVRKATSRRFTSTGQSLVPWSNLGVSPYAFASAFNPFPDRMRAILRYSDLIQITNSLGVPVPQQFRTNSIFDCDITNTGHQPYGHDTYQSIYNHYRVLSSTLTVTPMIPFNGRVAILLTDDTSISTDNKVPFEGKNTTYANQTDSKAVTVRNKFISNVSFPAGNLSSATASDFGTNPAENQCFSVCIYGTTPTASVTGIYFDCNLEFYVEMYELKDLGSS